MKLLPTFIVQFSFYLTKFISYSLGKDIPPIKLVSNAFGSGILTNVSTFNVKVDGFAPHISFCNTNFLMTICTPEEVPRQENG